MKKYIKSTYLLNSKKKKKFKHLFRAILSYLYITFVLWEALTRLFWNVLNLNPCNSKINSIPIKFGLKRFKCISLQDCWNKWKKLGDDF